MLHNICMHGDCPLRDAEQSVRTHGIHRKHVAATSAVMTSGYNRNHCIDMLKADHKVEWCTHARIHVSQPARECHKGMPRGNATRECHEGLPQGNGTMVLQASPDQAAAGHLAALAVEQQPAWPSERMLTTHVHQPCQMPQVVPGSVAVAHQQDGQGCRLQLACCCYAGQTACCY